MIAILTGVRWNFSVILICISFMARDVEHFFHVVFGHLDIFLCSVTHFFIGSLILGTFSFLSSL
jgi:hypothetical protein